MMQESWYQGFDRNQGVELCDRVTTRNAKAATKTGRGLQQKFTKRTAWQVDGTSEYPAGRNEKPAVDGQKTRQTCVLPVWTRLLKIGIVQEKKRKFSYGF